MTRVVSLFLPTWSTDRVRRKAGDAAPPIEAPLALVGRDGRKQLVLAVDAAALAAGARVGMRARSIFSFLREDLRRRRIVTCQEAMDARDGRWLQAAGIVVVRQRPGSAKGVMFITPEEESGIANLVVWAKAFEQFRRVVLSASMIAVRGRIQREGDVVHLVARRLTDLSGDLASVGDRDAAFPLPHGRGDQVRNGGSGPDPRDFPTPAPDGHRYDSYGKTDQIKVKTRDFR
ncbi:hypothetical protein ACVWYH_005136 [Bradyrhizobium sp. GM24.11]